MTKEEIYKRFKGGFGVENDESYYLNVDWLFDERNQKDDFMQLLGYDANMFPLPDLSKWNNKEWVQENIDTILRCLKDYDIEVWLDDVKIKSKGV